MESIEQKENVDVFSIKLINGDSILSEIVEDAEADENGYVVLMNPISIQFVESEEGQMTVGREYDPLSDEAVVMLPAENLLSEPLIASDLYRVFYANTLVYSLTKKIRAELTSKKDELDALELQTAVVAANQHLETFITQISERYNVRLVQTNPNLDSIVPANVTKH